ETIPERERWLNEADPSEDERVVERRVQLLIDKGELRRAKELLLSVPFQRIHQRYVRTMMWNELCEKLNEPNNRSSFALRNSPLSISSCTRRSTTRSSSLGSASFNHRSRSGIVSAPARRSRSSRSATICGCDCNVASRIDRTVRRAP